MVVLTKTSQNDPKKIKAAFRNDETWYEYFPHPLRYYVSPSKTINKTAKNSNLHRVLKLDTNTGTKLKRITRGPSSTEIILFSHAEAINKTANNFNIYEVPT